MGQRELRVARRKACSCPVDHLGASGKRGPGTRSVERKAIRICQRVGNRYTERKKFYPWWAIWPTRAGWKEGDRTAQCFVPYEQFVKTTTG